MSNEQNTQEQHEKIIKNMLGFVLLKDANLDWPRFFKELREKWHLDVSDDEVKDGSVVLRINDMLVACSLMPSPVPDHEAENNAKNSVMWTNAAEEVAKHQAHCMIAIMSKNGTPTDQAKLFAKVAASMLILKNAIGIYKFPTCYPCDFYLKTAEVMQHGEFPTPIAVHVGMYLTEGGKMNAYTTGMQFFGKDEFEVVGTLAQPGYLYSFMISVAEYLITEDETLRPGETIGFTEEQKLPLTKSPGAALPIETIKIGLMQG
ncbi:DUF4261 domain-containing protein [Ruminococcus sp. NK3A76]|uniref:DUF4261 domain-containing protein n=1 Tax=Ruminococcus sp. NK3A76 TaxID=877411 RepID=UPI00048B58E4|nr:DUF4261 domain-containing protein [Ruminococcus sp. NK3A76]